MINLINKQPIDKFLCLTNFQLSTNYRSSTKSRPINWRPSKIQSNFRSPLPYKYFVGVTPIKSVSRKRLKRLSRFRAGSIKFN